MFEILDDLATRSSELESHMTSLEYAIIHFPLAKLCSTPSVVQNNVDQEIYEHFMSLQRDLLGLRSLFTVFLRLLTQICSKLDGQVEIFKQIQNKLVRRWERILDLVLSLESNLILQIEQNGRIKIPPRRLSFLVCYWKKEDEVALTSNRTGDGVCIGGSTSNIEFNSDMQTAVQTIKDNETAKEAPVVPCQYVQMDEYRSSVRKKPTADEYPENKPHPAQAQGDWPNREAQIVNSAAPYLAQNCIPTFSISTQNRTNQNPETSKTAPIIPSKGELNHRLTLTREENLSIQCHQCCTVLEIPLKQLIPLIDSKIAVINHPNLTPRQQDSATLVSLTGPVLHSSSSNQPPNQNILFASKTNDHHLKPIKSSTEPPIAKSQVISASPNQVKHSVKVPTDSSTLEKSSNTSRNHKEFLKEIKSGHKSVKDLFDDIDRSTRFPNNADTDLIVSATINRSNRKPAQNGKSESENVKVGKQSRVEPCKVDDSPPKPPTFVSKTLIEPQNITQKTLDIFDDGLQSTQNEIFTSTPRSNHISRETLESDRTLEANELLLKCQFLPQISVKTQNAFETFETHTTKTDAAKSNQTCPQGQQDTRVNDPEKSSQVHLSIPEDAKTINSQLCIPVSNAVAADSNGAISASELNNLGPNDVYVSQFRKKLEKFPFQPQSPTSAE